MYFFNNYKNWLFKEEKLRLATCMIVTLNLKLFFNLLIIKKFLIKFTTTEIFLLVNFLEYKKFYNFYKFNQRS